MCPAPAVPTASVETANVDGKMLAFFFFIFVVVLLCFEINVVCYTLRREPRRILGGHLQRCWLTLEHWGVPWWAWTELVEGLQRSHCCWEKEVMGQDGMELGELRSGGLERG